VSIISVAIFGGLIGLGFALVCWRRRQEIDRNGDICLRYFGPKYAFPLSVVFWLCVGIYHIDDPEYLSHPENYFVNLAFIVLSLLASIHFVLYRITLKKSTIERSQWPFKPRRYSLNELTFIGEKRRESVLHFSSGKILKIPLLLSGQDRFIERVQESLLAHVGKRSSRPLVNNRKKRDERYP
jgi:hypothetical protein